MWSKAIPRVDRVDVIPEEEPVRGGDVNPDRVCAPSPIVVDPDAVQLSKRVGRRCGRRVDNRRENVRFVSVTTKIAAPRSGTGWSCRCIELRPHISRCIGVPVGARVTSFAAEEVATAVRELQSIQARSWIEYCHPEICRGWIDLSKHVGIAGVECLCKEKAEVRACQ